VAAALAVSASAAPRREPSSDGIAALDAVIASKVRQLAVLKRELERFTCQAPADAVAAAGCQQMAAQARAIGEELDELKERAGDGWTSEKQRDAEASAFEAPPPRPKPYTYRSRTNPSASYRTLCVRLCDGFYFPIGEAASPANFPGDEKLCRSRCSVPAALFYQPAPGGDAAEMVALTGERYADLPNAFRYRTEYIERCSCGPRPWSAEAGDAYHRRAVLATRTRTERIVAAGAETMAKILADAIPEVAQRTPSARAASTVRLEQFPERRGLFWRFRAARYKASLRRPESQLRNGQPPFLLFRKR
jgi:hypothetical protein